MRLPVSRILLFVCALLAVVPATAGAATAPKVTSVAPLKLKIGERLTIRGRGFLPGKNRNTVVFKASGARAVFAKAESATTTKLVVKVPAKIAPFLKVSAGRPAPTRFQLRVLARKLSPSYTPATGSPTIAPAVAATVTAPVAKKPAASDAGPAAAAPAAAAVSPAPPSNCDGDAQPDATDADDDNDLLDDVTERTIGTDTCNADTDGDSMQDGWEYQSAKDFNRESCPDVAYPVACPGLAIYPAKLAYTNPLYQDADQDYDGDYLTAGLEYKMWKAHAPNTLTDMWYSDGLQSSQDTSTSDSCVGMQEDPTDDGHVIGYPSGVEAFPTRTVSNPANGTDRWGWLYGDSEYTLDTDNPGTPGRDCLSDDERDEDGDFLSNGQENNRMLSGAKYVQTVFSEPAFRIVYPGTDPLDADSDGDNIVDGMDDQDQDDFWNVEEIRRGDESSKPVTVADGGDADTLPDTVPTDTGSRSGLWVDPYNPCLPAIFSRTCPRGVLIGATPWRPFYDEDAGSAPLRRWPLYNTSKFSGDPTTTPQAEIWGAYPAGQQTLPLRQPADPNPGPHHPLSPRPS